MKIINVVTVFMCSVAFSASAQMLDLVGSGAVGGAMTKAGVASVHQGMDVLKYTQIVQALSHSAMMIKVNHIKDYNRVGRRDITGNPFKPYGFDVGAVEGRRFYITLTNVDEKMCQRLKNAQVGAVYVDVNEAGNSGGCKTKSKIKFVFE